MEDFVNWFFAKHFYVAAVLFPELGFAFALWQRWYWSAAVLGAWLVVSRLWHWFGDVVVDWRS